MRDWFPVAHVVSNQRWDVVEALPLQAVLHLDVGVIQLHDLKEAVEKCAYLSDSHRMVHFVRLFPSVTTGLTSCVCVFV